MPLITAFKLAAKLGRSYRSKWSARFHVSSHCGISEDLDQYREVSLGIFTDPIVPSKHAAAAKTLRSSCHSTGLPSLSGDGGQPLLAAGGASVITAAMSVGLSRKAQKAGSSPKANYISSFACKLKLFYTGSSFTWLEWVTFMDNVGSDLFLFLLPPLLAWDLLDVPASVVPTQLLSQLLLSSDEAEDIE
ncbi:hypothetical protein BX600DRAFT_443466 [Xylariales sp. PMI_506]|nr:hypothetical protein BX600DRAFT_443466 [Xylariales sp. PMI_506]